MESNIKSPSPDNAAVKAEFRKPSNDATNRKYRRRSPLSGSSSSDGSPRHAHSSSPVHSKEDPARGSDPRQRKDDGRDLDCDSGRNRHGRSGDLYRQSDRKSSRTSHNYHRHDDYVRREKYTDEEERNYYKSSRSDRESRAANHSDHLRRESEHYRSRDYLRGDDKYLRDRSDASGHRSRGRERETSSLENMKHKDKYSSSDRARSGRKRTSSNAEDIKSGEGDRFMAAGDGRDEKTDYRRSLGESKGTRSPVYEEYKGRWNDTSSRKDSAGYIFKEDSKNDCKELDGPKYTKEERKQEDRESSRHRERYRKELGERSEDGAASNENQESGAKKAKVFASNVDHGKNVSKFTTVADERQSLSSKQVQELVGNLTFEQAPVRGSDAANDIDAAKMAAMKAAELVNRNLVGTGYMSADQKKKLLWGNKKNTTAESGHHWDTAQFSDRERQEKFNKLMGVKGEVKGEPKPENQDGNAEKQRELQLDLDLEKQYTAGLRRRDGRTVGLGL